MHNNTASAGAIILLGLLGYVDYITGYDLNFFVFYYIPIALISWTAGRNAGILMSLASALVWMAMDQLSGHSYPHWAYEYWNTGIRFVSFVILALSLAKLHNLYAEEKQLRKTLEQTLAEVKQLKGFIPICASCKKVRDDSGYWNQVEKYLAARTDASFTHGICPDCAQKLYPGLGEHTAGRHEEPSSVSGQT